jgi:hypothetical protein
MGLVQKPEIKAQQYYLRWQNKEVVDASKQQKGFKGGVRKAVYTLHSYPILCAQI